jgi:hypothetical protein
MQVGWRMRTCTHLFRTLCSRRSEVVDWACAGRHFDCNVQCVCKCAVCDTDEVRTGVNGWLAACQRTDGLAATTRSRLGLATRHNTPRLDSTRLNSTRSCCLYFLLCYCLCLGDDGSCHLESASPNPPPPSICPDPTLTARSAHVVANAPAPTSRLRPRMPPPMSGHATPDLSKDDLSDEGESPSPDPPCAILILILPQLSKPSTT